MRVTCVCPCNPLSVVAFDFWCLSPAVDDVDGVGLVGRCNLGRCVPKVEALEGSRVTCMPDVEGWGVSCGHVPDIHGVGDE